jgi:hypothetical protein
MFDFYLFIYQNTHMRRIIIFLFFFPSFSHKRGLFFFIMSYSTLFRSEEMSLIQLYIPAEVSHSCLAELGEIGKVQFRDVSLSIPPLPPSQKGGGG